jgi:type IV pilus assembly protein PilC
MMNTYLLQKKIRGAMIDPAIIVVVIIAIGILMLIYVVPTLTAVFSELSVKLSWNTQLIISGSTFLKEHPVMASSLFVLIIVSLGWARSTSLGKHFMDTVLLHLPVIGTIVRESNSARTARTLSSLLQSGVEVVTSLEITADVVSNVHFKKVLLDAREHIKKGEPLSAAFAAKKGLYPAFVSEMISIGEETGKLGEMLSNVADFYEEEVSQKTKDLSTIIEPVLMVVVGAAVAFFAVSMLSPIYSLVNAF